MEAVSYTHLKMLTLKEKSAFVAGLLQDTASNRGIDLKPVSYTHLDVYKRQRKSLWIETFLYRWRLAYRSVRLVRACGSKPLRHQTKRFLLWVRLVRACGSKPACSASVPANVAVRLVRACGSKHRIFCNDIVIGGSGS